MKINLSVPLKIKISPKYTYIYLYLSEFTKTDPKKHQTQSEYRGKNLSKLDIL